MLTDGRALMAVTGPLIAAQLAYRQAQKALCDAYHAKNAAAYTAALPAFQSATTTLKAALDAYAAAF
jgi:hypothetical protein